MSTTRQTVSIVNHRLNPHAITAKDQAHAHEIERVLSALETHVLKYCQVHLDAVIHAEDLEAYVKMRTGCAPGSATRILRALRSKGRVQYEVKSRRESLYKIVEVQA